MLETVDIVDEVDAPLTFLCDGPRCCGAKEGEKDEEDGEDWLFCGVPNAKMPGGCGGGVPAADDGNDDGAAASYPCALLGCSPPAAGDVWPLLLLAANSCSGPFQRTRAFLAWSGLGADGGRRRRLMSPPMSTEREWASSLASSSGLISYADGGGDEAGEAEVDG